MQHTVEPPPIPKGLPPERYLALMDAAMGEFAEHGYELASMRRIAEGAGVSKALPFHYFASKQGLFLDTYRYGTATLYQRLEPARPQPGDDLFTAIARLTRAKFELARKHPKLTDFMIRAYCEDAEPVRAALAGLNQDLLVDQQQEVLELSRATALREGVTPEVAVNLLTWVSEGFVRHELARPDTDSEGLEQRMDSYLAVLHHGLAKDENDAAQR